MFGDDVAVAARVLDGAGGAERIEDAEEGSLAFNPEHADAVRAAGAEVHTCYFVYENGEDGSYLVDVALR